MFNNHETQEFYPKLQSKRHYPEDKDYFDKRYPGDKTYKTPEYSENFHKLGSTRPKVEFGKNFTKPKITETVLVDDLPNVLPDSNLFVTMGDKIEAKKKILVEDKKAENLNKEINEVKELEDWEPAPVLEPFNFMNLNNKYGPFSVGYVRKYDFDNDKNGRQSLVWGG